MSTDSSRSSSSTMDEELRLPRPPGVVRRFWAKHPLLADILIAIVCLPLSVAPTTFLAERPLPAPAAIAASILILGACVLLVWRRRYPLVVFAVAYAVSTFYLLLLTPSGTPLLLVASYSLAVYRSVRAAWIGLAVGVGVLLVISFALFAGGAISLQVTMNVVLGEFATGLIGTLIGANVRGRRRYLAAVIDRSKQLFVERDQHAQLAASAERDRIAREMHDILSHSLTVVVALSEGAAATNDAERARSASRAAADTARSALTEMRSMLGVLREGDTDAPLAPTAPVCPSDTVAAAQRAGFAATLTTTGESDLPPAHALAVGRIVQEGVTNAMRHAPRATRIDVRIDYTDEHARIEISNDGAHAPQGLAGFGLRGLAERTTLLGGTFRSEPAGAGRWMLRADLPRPSGAST